MKIFPALDMQKREEVEEHVDSLAVAQKHFSVLYT